MRVIGEKKQYFSVQNSKFNRIGEDLLDRIQSIYHLKPKNKKKKET